MAIPTPTAAWNFDNSPGNLVDATGNGYTLTNDGTTLFGSAKINEGPNFTASNTKRLVISNNLGSNGSAFSFMIWANPSSLSGSKYIFDFDALSTNYRHILYHSGTSIRFYCKGNEGTGYTASTGNWYQLVATRSGTSCKFYVNGSFVSSFTAGAGGDSSRNEMAVGNTTGATTAEFNGTLDIAACWAVELTASEVTELYNGGAGLQYPYSVANNSGFFLAMAR